MTDNKNSQDINIANHFYFIVGTDAERSEAKLPSGNWLNSNPFANKYDLGYHTGLDLNLNIPYFNADRGQFIYSCANGEVFYADRVLIPSHSSWGNLVCILHTLPDGRQIVSRYGHVENLLIKKGDIVSKGQLIAQVGNAFGRFAYHLHFDLITNIPMILKTPWDWPGFNLSRVYKDYIDPISFIRSNRIVSITTPFIANKALVTSINNLNIRTSASMYSKKIGSVPKNTIFTVLNKVTNGYVPLEDNSGYVSEKELQYISNPEGNLMRKTNDELTIRQKPTKTSKSIGTLEADQLIEIIGIERNEYTALSNKRGWVLTNYLRAI